jgi:hypothetical protein
VTYIDFFKACALTSAAAPKLDMIEAGHQTGDEDEKIGINALQIRTARNRRCVSYLSYTKPICQLIGLNRDLEWRRAVAVMCYFQGLPFGIAAYCLLVRFPARSKRSFALRCAVCASLALVSLVAFPPIAAWLFPSYKSPFSPNNPNYYKVLIITILVGIAAVLAAGVFLLTRLRKPTPAQITDTCAKVGITLVLSFLIASAYGLILGIVGNVLDMWGVSVNLQGTVKGAVIIAAVLIQRKR